MADADFEGLAQRILGAAGADLLLWYDCDETVRPSDALSKRRGTRAYRRCKAV